MKLAGQPWLAAAATRRVMQALHQVGGEDCARFVGGCVRNTLLGAPVDDVDIATRLRPEDTLRAIEAAGLKAVPTGIEHGTVTAISDRRPFEITTLRRDVSTDGRRATVAFTDSWAEDAARRDFRLNALYADAGGEVFDPTGEGVADALAGRIVFVGEPETRIREDYLRILRFFRFQAWYGRGEPDPAGLAACSALAPGMDRLSAERVSKELMKLLAAPQPLDAIRAMDASGVLAQILPEAEVSSAFETAVDLSSDSVFRLMTLVPPEEAAALEISRRLRLPNAVRDRMAAAARAQAAVDLGMEDRSARAAVYRFGAGAVADVLLRRLAEFPQRKVEADRLLDLVRSWTPPKLPVGGRHLAKLGVSPGPDTGRLLKAFEESWVADDFPGDGHEERLARLVSRGRA
jgi:poly(A) polymerase